MRALFCRPAGVWMLTIMATAILLGVGFEVGYRLSTPRLAEVQEQAAHQAERAARLEAENAALERRLQRLEGSLGAPGIARDTAPEPELEVTSRLIRRGEAELLLDGKLVLTLEELVKGPDRAVLKFETLDGRAGRKVLSPGQHVTVKVEGRPYRLTLKKVFGNSASFSLLAQ